MSVDCIAAREGLWPPERPRLVGDAVAAARSHVDSCEACRSYFQQDRALLDLYDRARRQPAPLAVRERVFDAIARARWPANPPAPPRRSHGSRHARWPAAALVALVATLLAANLREAPASQGDGASMFVEDYLRRAVGEDYIVTDDPAAVRHFLQRELGMQLSPLDLPDLTITRVEICLLDGRRGAMIVYDKGGEGLSHYLVPRGEAARRTPALSIPSSESPTMPVVTWATTGVEQALVGDVDPDSLLRLVTESYDDE